ncbi:MAG: hypothetical protein QM662_09660 [Gordonia sp. (in: high G+C Gram-positive bacteria)]
MNAEGSRRRVEYQSLGGALGRLDTANPAAAQVLAALARVVVDEAERSPRFARALTDAVAAAAGVATPPAVPAARRPPASRMKRGARQPGVFDPFVVYRDCGAEGLAERLATLDLDQLRDIIAEYDLDTRRQMGRKRKLDVIAAWIVGRVEASENKGSVFR